MASNDDDDKNNDNNNINDNNDINNNNNKNNKMIKIYITSSPHPNLSWHHLNRVLSERKTLLMYIYIYIYIYIYMTAPMCAN